MKVSIITVVYNNKRFIAGCIKSILNQTYKNIEIIVVDGASTDGTQQEIKPFIGKLGCYVSEPDQGIYDAFNKGIKNSTGDIIGILNSDDVFYKKEIIRNIVKSFQITGADLIYGKGMYVSPADLNKVYRIYTSDPFKKEYLNFGWIPLHPTIYVKREIYEKYGLYNPGYSIAGDYDISLRWFQNENIKKFYLNQWTVKMRLGGKSTSLSLQRKKSAEDLKIIRSHGLSGLFTLCFKIGRKIPQYILPYMTGGRPVS